MNTKILAFFNNKGGTGKTSLVYHLAWMYKDLGLRVVAADLDPQVNLTTSFLDDDRAEELWPNFSRDRHPHTIFGYLESSISGQIADSCPVGVSGHDPHLEDVENHLSYIPGELALLVGDLSLARFEDRLDKLWPQSLDDEERVFQIISAFWSMMQKTADIHKADLILMDLGSNLGVINRAALIAADYVVVPLTIDLFSSQCLRNSGPSLRRWRQNWQERLTQNPAGDWELPKGAMEPIGYIVLLPQVRYDRPVKAYNRWMAEIPNVYREALLNEPGDDNISVSADPHCVALLKNYQTLMPMATDARKPLFHLKPADGAIGAYGLAAKKADLEFASLARAIASRIDVKIP